MSRLFITQRELAFISDINKEFTRDIVGQYLLYFPISELKTRSHGLYNESTKKVYDNPIRIPALVGVEEAPIETTIFGPDYNEKITAYVQYNDVLQNNISMSVGDFVKWGDSFFEIAALVRMRQIYGHEEELDGWRLECVQARSSQFSAPYESPTERSYTDDGAVQETFSQTRGEEMVGNDPTGDKRTLREREVLPAPITGPKQIVKDKKTKSKFYGE